MEASSIERKWALVREWCDMRDLAPIEVLEILKNYNVEKESAKPAMETLKGEQFSLPLK